MEIAVRCFKTITGLRTYLTQYREHQTIGLVPTMGALHSGHGSLIQRAAAETDVVVVSIFVNPLQFGPQEDLASYPRDLERDSQLAQTWGASVLFAPDPLEMGLQRDNSSQSSSKTLVIPPPELTEGLCGAFRPGHFTGVATIVTQLLQIVQPHCIYFGEKDAQQLVVIRRLVQDLNLPVEIKGCPTIREVTGLALSSRNQYLNETEKIEAANLYRSLTAAKSLFQKDINERSYLLNTVKNQLSQTPNVRLQYVDLVDPQTLQPLQQIKTSGLLAIAAYLGKTRLIDNLLLRYRQPIIAIDGPAGAGKSTVTRQVADELGLVYLDTGAMYRAIAFLVRESQVDPADEASVAELVSRVQIELISRPAPQLMGIKINERDVSEAIRTPEVTNLVSAIAAQKAVRQVLVKNQQFLGEKGGLVAEGRDIGTHVFPDAEVKIFLTASVEERARRRFADFQAQGKTEITLEQLVQDIARRDELDSNRTISPLKKAVDAIEINTDGLSISQVIAQIIAIFERICG